MLDTDPHISIDQLEQDVLACEHLITKLRNRQAKALRELDIRQVRMLDGARSLQEWVRARFDVSDGTARDLVHAARELADQTDIEELAVAGRHSFDRIVATSRLAASGADDETVERSFGYDIGAVTRLRHRQRRITRQDEATTFANRHVYIQDSIDGARDARLWICPGSSTFSSVHAPRVSVGVAE